MKTSKRNRQLQAGLKKNKEIPHGRKRLQRSHNGLDGQEKQFDNFADNIESDTMELEQKITEDYELSYEQALALKKNDLTKTRRSRNQKAEKGSLPSWAR